jgi:glycosyltransferase involved in cell wall biosynthesis
MSKNHRRVGILSTRLAGTDGVSLETQKWVTVLEHLGFECYFFAGECEWPAERSYVVPEAHFEHPSVRAINVDLFDDYTRSKETSAVINDLKILLKNHLYEFIDQFGIDLLIAENILAIPMNIPLGLGLTELIAETDIPTIAHHHDFAWERSRFKISAASDYQLGAFPPILHSVKHVVINSYGGRQLALRTGATSTLIPNVMDFDTPPSVSDEFVEGLREDLGIGPDEYLILQPTRIVPRKRIELAIELVWRLDKACHLVISHASGDEGHEYQDHLVEYAKTLDVNLILAADRVNHLRGVTAEGDKIYSLADLYQQADLITYPSTVEGFGNAFLETIYFKKPIVISAYEIFQTDIQPKGFEVISFNDYISGDTIRQATKILEDPTSTANSVEHNYELGIRYYSYSVLERKLAALMTEYLGSPS